MTFVPMDGCPPLDSLPDAVLDTLVSHILQTCPPLTICLLSAFGTRIHASAVRVLFTSITFPDDARYFLPSNIPHAVPRHLLSAILMNSGRYARAIKRITITDTGLPPPSTIVDLGKTPGLVGVDEDEDSDSLELPKKHPRVAIQPMPARNLIGLLTVCMNLEGFIWKSSNPPPDGVLSEHCPRLVNFAFSPDAPLRIRSEPQTGTVSHPNSRPNVPKWDAPSLPLLAVLPLTRLHITRLSQQGARALAALFSHFGEFSLLEDVEFDFVWLDDPLCEKIVEAGRRIKRLRVGTSGTKLTDKGLVSIFEGCDSLEEFSLIEAQGRLSRNLWSKVNSLPTNLHTFKVAMSENGPHHSWTADHLHSFPMLQLDGLSHLSVLRLIPPPHFSASGDILEYDPHIDDVAALNTIPKDVVSAIRGATALTTLECDWWSWKPEDVKALLERCTRLEYLKLAINAPFTKLLTLTSAFTPLTQLLKLSVCVPPDHAPGPIPVPASPTLKMSPSHPLTPAASPVRRRKSLPSPDIDHCSQFFCVDDLKLNGSVDPSLPPTRDVKRFVKKCPRLIELEWYGRNARGKWLVTRSVSTSKINTNVGVEYYPPVASPSVWERASVEKAATEAVQSGGSLSQNIERLGQAWTGFKAEQFYADRAAEKEREDIALSLERPSRLNGSSKRSTSSLTSITASVSGSMVISTDRQSSSNHSPVIPFTPLSPPTSTKSFADHAPQAPSNETSSKTSRQSSDSSPPRRIPSEPSLRTNGTGGGRARSATASGGGQSGSGSSNGRGRNSNSTTGQRDGRGIGRGGGSSGKSGVVGGGPRRNTTSNGGGPARTGTGGGRGRGGRRKPSMPSTTS